MKSRVKVEKETVGSRHTGNMVAEPRRKKWLNARTAGGTASTFIYAVWYLWTLANLSSGVATLNSQRSCLFTRPPSRSSGADHVLTRSSGVEGAGRATRTSDQDERPGRGPDEDPPEKSKVKTQPQRLSR
ncbi:hypothetical protein E4U54_000207 [Claviceps lovelessii]|nr:hypothetical protein E4U54_000207 [Claviceps lovelessii]